MLFPSQIFIFVFLPCVIVGYYLLGIFKKPIQNLFLFIMSLAFYAWGESSFFIIMLLCIAINYLFALLIDKISGFSKKLLTGLAICLNVGLLLYYKYYNFFIQNLNLFSNKNLTFNRMILPLGISFFTFQALSYIIDVYRGQVKVQKNPIYVGLYITFFPQLIAGPIVRYDLFSKYLEHRTETFSMFKNGVSQFIIGLAKKVILANSLAVVADAAYLSLEIGNLSSSFAWLGSLCYTLQIYYDFSGYSSMAIGLANMFGFKLPPNFNYPYTSTSFTDFWRRWHITLGTWFRDYVYLPLGGSRGGPFRHIFNLLIIWFLTGLWHGAGWNFIVWGLFYFFLLVMEKYLLNRSAKIRENRIWGARIWVLLSIHLSWVLFRSPTLSFAISFIKIMFGIGTPFQSCDSFIFYLQESQVYILFAIIFATPLARQLKRKLRYSLNLGIYSVIETVFLMFLFIISISYIVIGGHNPFIYFNF